MAIPLRLQRLGERDYLRSRGEAFLPVQLRLLGLALQAIVKSITRVARCVRDSLVQSGSRGGAWTEGGRT